MIRQGLLLFVAVAPMLAQEQRPSTPPPVLIDTVVATVNDSAIMHSELATLTAGRIRTLEARGVRLRPADKATIYEDELRKRIDHHTWAQAAKTFGYLPPEQVEAWFQREIEREEQNLVRDLGGYQAFSRALQDQSRTWPTYVREKRVDKMADFAQGFAVDMRMQRQSNLYVTPRMLRETYEASREQFVHDAEAKVAMVSFRGVEAAANAAKAAAMWRIEDIPCRALADRFRDATPIDNVLASSLIPELASFALAGPVDRVSDPIESNGSVQVARIIAYLPASNGAFEDREVQDKLRTLCEGRVAEEFAFQALKRARERTEVWPRQQPR